MMRSRRNKWAALKLTRKLLKKQGCVPETIVADRLQLCGSAFKILGLWKRHVQGGRLNNRVEVSHQPTRMNCGGKRLRV